MSTKQISITITKEMARRMARFGFKEGEEYFLTAKPLDWVTSSWSRRFGTGVFITRKEVRQ